MAAGWSGDIPIGALRRRRTLHPGGNRAQRALLIVAVCCREHYARRGRRPGLWRLEVAQDGNC
jgi:hypothetical protein